MFYELCYFNSLVGPINLSDHRISEKFPNDFFQATILLQMLLEQSKRDIF